MPTPAKTYRKHNSFVAIRQKRPLSDARARLEKLLKSGPTGVVKQACEEALGVTAPPKGHEAFTLHDNVQEELARLTDAELPRYLHYRFRYETYPDRKILDQFPPCIQIEPTSACNFRCVFCYQTDAEFTSKKNGHMGSMSLDTFKLVVDQCVGNIE